MTRELKKSERIYIRTKKSEIRKKFWDVKKQQELISDLYKRVLGGAGAVAEVLPKKAKKAKVEVKQKQKTKTASEGKAKMKNKKKVK